MANKAGTQLIDATRGADGRFTSVHQLHAERTVRFQQRFTSICMTVVTIVYFVVWRLWISKPLTDLLRPPVHAFTHWLGWS